MAHCALNAKGDSGPDNVANLLALMIECSDPIDGRQSVVDASKAESLIYDG
jgi:hypothetical protein